MIQEPKCPDCQLTMRKSFYKNQLWFSCGQCTANYISVSSFKEILSDYEFNRFTYEIKNEKVLSNKNCPCCQIQMIKVLDLVQVNQVEVCKNCNLVWLDPNEGAKIKADQQNSPDRKMHLNLQTELNLRLSEGLNNPVYYSNAVFKDMFKFLLEITMLEDISKTNPVLAFFLMIVIGIICFLFFYYFHNVVYMFYWVKMMF